MQRLVTVQTIPGCELTQHQLRERTLSDIHHVDVCKLRMYITLTKQGIFSYTYIYIIIYVY